MFFGGLHADLAPLRVPMSQEQYDRLLQAIVATIEKQAGGTWTILETPGFTETDRFFAAMGSFHILQTCNTWIGRMIREAGLPFGSWVPLPYSVTLSHRVFLAPESWHRTSPCRRERQQRLRSGSG